MTFQLIVAPIDEHTGTRVLKWDRLKLEEWSFYSRENLRTLRKLRDVRTLKILLYNTTSATVITEKPFYITLRSLPVGVRLQDRYTNICFRCGSD